MTRDALGKSRVRESRPPGSVRAKPNGRATRPRSSPAKSHRFRFGIQNQVTIRSSRSTVEAQVREADQAELRLLGGGTYEEVPDLKLKWIGGRGPPANLLSR